MRRTLIVKFGAIGDVLMAIPAAHEMHSAGSEIDWLCGPAVLPLLQLYPWINPIVADDRALILGSSAEKLRALAGIWRSLAGRRYDLAAVLYYDKRYRWMTLPVRATRKLLLSHTDRAYRLLPGRHHTDEFARILLGRPDGLNPGHLAPVIPERLPPSPLPRTATPRVLLAPAGAKNMLSDDALRRWPAENYVALAAALLAQNIEIVLIGGPGDAWIQPLFSALPVVDLIGRLSLPETLSLMDAADVVVTHDTGPLHMAGITRAGIVTLFGPTDPAGRLPQRPGALALWGGEGFACRPCYDAHGFPDCPANDCMRQWAPHMVADEVLSMLAARARGELPAACVKVPPSTMPSGRLVQL